MNPMTLKQVLVISARVGLVVALGSCAPPKAIVIAEAPLKKKVEPKVESLEVPGLPMTGLPDDGIRMPEMLGLPGDGEFRATNPSLPKTAGDTGAVISRPPTDPPSRVKPKPTGTE
jgi:hypothetical protein